MKVGRFANAVLTMTSRALQQGYRIERDPRAPAGTSARLAHGFRQKQFYRQVRRESAPWNETSHSACVAFVTTALRHVGVPLRRGQRLDGMDVTRVTLPLSRYLEERLGWQRMDAMSELRPGDVVFTDDAPCCPGIPDRVFVFMGWVDPQHTRARVVDDQSFVRESVLVAERRDDRHHHDDGHMTFSYALRAL